MASTKVPPHARAGQVGRGPRFAADPQCWANEHEDTRHEEVMMNDAPFNRGCLAGVLLMIGALAVGWFIQSPDAAHASALRTAAVVVQAVIGFGGAAWLYARERARATRTS